MDLNTYSQRPDWLTDEIVEELKKDLVRCSNPYTEEEVEELECDGYIDIKRANAKTAKDILVKYGIL
ncbi:MAG: hypothetical protein U0M12_08205 [Acutalibacteraceae bacterium]|nr:hypothetical protein [Acutalibacteraceae bacterium]